MTLRRIFTILLFAPIPVFAAPADQDLQAQFDTTVRPFVVKNCTGCHSGANAAAQFDLKSFTSVAMVREDFGRWSLLAERLKAKEMPPKPLPAPPANDTAKVISWVDAVRQREMQASAGDPGVVLARRLSNAEYNYTIRDLTGQDLQIARQFPVDPANTAGFDNSGESLTMSPALLNKYLAGAREIANHAVLTPNTIEFAPHTMLVETDRERYAIARILQFYAAQPVDYARYFEAAWRFRYRKTLGSNHATLASTAESEGVSSKYLPLIWEILHDHAAVGPVAKLQGMWNGLPIPRKDEDGPLLLPKVKAQCTAMRDFVTRIRAHTAMQFSAPIVAGLPAGSQPLLNWKLREYTLHRRESDPHDLRNDTDGPLPVTPIPPYPGLHKEAAPRWAALSAQARANDADLTVPAKQRGRYEKAFARFAFVFPDAFYVTERGRYFPDNSADTGRLLSAGYHSVVGFWRDDVPLMQLILNDPQQAQLNRLWDEFDFIADATARTWTQYFFNQSGEVAGKGAESGTPRPTDHLITDAPVILAMRSAYLAKAAANSKNDPVAPEAIREHFGRMNATLRHIEDEHHAAESKHLAELLRFAERAYRRPLTDAEKTDLLGYYQTLHTKNQLSHDDAIRESIVAVLMSPDFLYRLDLTDASASAPPQHQTASLRTAAELAPNKPEASFHAEPVSGYTLASRLSYFLWSSLPDAELLRHAAAGDLQRPEVLLAQTHRMLKDERVRGLATEWTGNWLGSRLFQTNNSVDRARFPTFNDDLRQAMFEEPVRLIQDALSGDHSVLDLLYGRYTFVNAPLARHYGMPPVTGDNSHWVRVDDADRYGRGGLLPMAVFLTQNSPGLRTSPVKRGNWVVQRVLGIRVPPPPPVVPELPGDESKSDLPVREMLAKHRSNPVCAACHARFDSFGLAFEGYGPVGNARTHDLAGRPIDSKVTYPGGVDGEGLVGLQSFIRGYRQTQFLTAVSRKLLAYALNRSLQLGDEPLVEQMQTNLVHDGYRFDSLVETIVQSPQFLNKRVPGETKEPLQALLQQQGKKGIERE